MLKMLEKCNPEIKLLLCCAQSSLDAKSSVQWRKLLQENLDWDYLLLIARRHKLMSLLYWHLNQTGREIVPLYIWEQLQEYFDRSLQRNQLLTAELFRLLNLFKDHRIPAIPYKGSTLTIAAYGNLALRSFRDIDILVHPEDINKAKKLLSDQGYILTSEIFWENEFRSKDDQIVIDLHRAITPKFFPFSFDFDDCQQRLGPVLIDNKPIYTFSTEDLLLILCVYFARDCWQKKEKLIQICDIAQIIRTYSSINWEWLLKQSRKLGSERMLLLGLFLTQEILEIKLPEEVLAKIKLDPIINSLAGQVWLWLFPATDTPDLGLQRKVFYVKVRERIQDIIPHIPYLVQYSLTPSQTDRDFLELPDYLFFLYYLIRPIRFVIRYGQIAVKGFH